MGKRVFVSADWKEDSSNTRSCDKVVVDRIRKWESDGRLSVEIDCTDDVHDSVVDNLDDCRRCDIKRECGSHINWSSTVIFVIGDNTATKSAGACDSDECSPAYSGKEKLPCKLVWSTSSSDADVHTWDGTLYKNEMGMSYLKYEITKSAQLGKSIILVFNSMREESSWIPTWYDTLCNNETFMELCRVPFWKDIERKEDCYHDIKGYLL